MTSQEAKKLIEELKRKQAESEVELRNVAADIERLKQMLQRKASGSGKKTGR